MVSLCGVQRKAANHAIRLTCGIASCCVRFAKRLSTETCEIPRKKPLSVRIQAGGAKGGGWEPPGQGSSRRYSQTPVRTASGGIVGVAQVSAVNFHLKKVKKDCGAKTEGCRWPPAPRGGFSPGASQARRAEGARGLRTVGFRCDRFRNASSSPPMWASTNVGHPRKRAVGNAPV